MAFEPLQSGDPIKPTAFEWNAMLSAGQKALAGSQGITPIDGQRGSLSQSMWVWVKNESGSDRNRYEVMSLGDPLWDLDLTEQRDLIFAANSSAADSTPVVLITPIANGKIGRGVIDGLALAKVGAGTNTLRFANIGTHKLTPAAGGDVRLLGAPSPSADKLLPVILSVGGVTDLRLSGNNLQYRKGGAWFTWTTGTTC